MSEEKHFFDKSGYYLIQDYSGTYYSSFAFCKKCWDEKVKTDKKLYKLRFFCNWIGGDKVPWKPELVPENCECEFDKFKERIYSNI